VSNHRETERVLQESSWGQGDLIRIEWPEDESGPKFGVVINADCDLEHGKTDDVFAFLPIYTFKAYLSLFWVNGHIQEVTKSATQASLGLADDSDDAALHAWLRTSDAASVSA